MNLENVLSERCMTQQASYHMLPFKRNVWNKQIHKDRKKSSSFQGLSRGQVERDYDWVWAFSWDEDILKFL